MPIWRKAASGPRPFGSRCASASDGRRWCGAGLVPAPVSVGTRSTRPCVSASRPPPSRQYLVGEIFIDASRVGGQQAAMNGANQLVQQMHQGAPFQAVARQFSAAPSAASGGDAGWVVQGRMPPGPATRPWTAWSRPALAPDPGRRRRLHHLPARQARRRRGQPGAAEAGDDRAAGHRRTDDAGRRRHPAARSPAPQPDLRQHAGARHRQEHGLLGADLGEADVQNLAPQFQQVARSAEVGSVSAPVRTPLGVHLLAVCGRRAGGPEAPDIRPGREPPVRPAALPCWRAATCATCAKTRSSTSRAEP